MKLQKDIIKKSKKENKKMNNDFEEIKNELKKIDRKLQMIEKSIAKNNDLQAYNNFICDFIKSELKKILKIFTKPE